MSSKSQQQPHNHNIPTWSSEFQAGRALFQKLSHHRVQAYSEFKRQSDLKMMLQLEALQFWRNNGGPRSRDEMVLSGLILQSLKRIRKLEAEFYGQRPGIFTAFSRLLQSLRGSNPISQMKPSINRPESTAKNESGSSSSLGFGNRWKVPEAGDKDVEKEDRKSLKQE